MLTFFYTHQFLFHLLTFNFCNARYVCLNVRDDSGCHGDPLSSVRRGLLIRDSHLVELVGSRPLMLFICITRFGDLRFGDLIWQPFYFLSPQYLMSFVWCKVNR